MISVNVIESGLGMSISTIIIIVFLVLGIVFMAKNFLVGLILYFLGSGMLTAWFYNAGWEWSRPVILTLVFFVLLSLTLYLTNRHAQTYGVV